MRALIIAIVVSLIYAPVLHAGGRARTKAAPAKKQTRRAKVKAKAKAVMKSATERTSAVGSRLSSKLRLRKKAPAKEAPAKKATAKKAPAKKATAKKATAKKATAKKATAKKTPAKKATAKKAPAKKATARKAKQPTRAEKRAARREARKQAREAKKAARTQRRYEKAYAKVMKRGGRPLGAIGKFFRIAGAPLGLGSVAAYTGILLGIAAPPLALFAAGLGLGAPAAIKAFKSIRAQTEIAASMGGQAQQQQQQFAPVDMIE
ncbi:MAG: hypothetical protein KJO07_26050 [Deltaproteobacteria bacterium]|nr:hypothetical protein [Deltaproteobacteria bacterium]